MLRSRSACKGFLSIGRELQLSPRFAPSRQEDLRVSPDLGVVDSNYISAEGPLASTSRCTSSRFPIKG